MKGKTHTHLTKADRAQLAALLLRLCAEIGGADGNLTIMIEPSARFLTWTIERTDEQVNGWDFESDDFEQVYQEALAHPTTRSHHGGVQ